MSELRIAGIAKWALIVLLAVVLVVQAAGNRSSSTDFEEMAGAVRQSTDVSLMTEGDNQMLKRLYGIDGAEYDGVMLYYPSSSMGAEEILLIHMKDPAQKEAVRTAMETRRAAQLSNFDGYGVEQTAMLENSIIDVKNNYALFVSAQDPAPVQEAFRKAY